MRRTWFAVVTAFVVIMAGVVPTAAAPQTTSRASAAIEAGLLGRLEAGGSGRYIVEFAATADLAAAESIGDFAGRGQYVLDTLRRTQLGSQAAARALVGRTRGATAESYWLTNVMLVTGDAALAERLARMTGVSRIRSEKVYPLVTPVATRDAVIAGTSAPEPGISVIRADDAWQAGILGSGVVVGSIDTGVEYTHPALVEQYRGNEGSGDFDHAYDWWDPTDICGDVPCDNIFHGTHTMGTMVGGDGPGPFTPDIGVAPGARWIAAKGCETDGCSEGALLSSGQFMLAPTDLDGEDPRPALRPDIVNNSWGGGPGDPFYQEVVTAWRAAGIVPVFAAGNAGPECGTAGSPGDYLDSFSVGATDFEDRIAEFSSRGPSVFGRTAPDVAAPGVNVVSAMPGDGYEAFDGTSMAAPHAAGALALVLSAEPGLAGQVEPLLEALRATAVDRIDEQCGGAPDGDPNNVYGEGRIDAYAAALLVATGGTLTGVVRDATDSQPIPGARVTAGDGGRRFTVVADEAGRYELFLAAGTYRVRAIAFGYSARVVDDVRVRTDETTTRGFSLARLPRFTLSGQVEAAEDGTPLPRASVEALGTPVPPAVTDASGAYSLELPVGDYTVEVTAGGCTTALTVDIEATGDITRDFELARKIDDFGHGCRPIAASWVDATNETGLFGDEFFGRLALPFGFRFYGTSYSQVFVSDNGYLTFTRPDEPQPFPVEIPSESAPNAAIYVLWQDLFLDVESSIAHRTVGTAPNRTFVIEFSGLRAKSASTARLDLEVKLHERGETIDILYGADDRADPADGRNAAIGIESAGGHDGLGFSFLERRAGPGTAYRFEPVATGVVTGSVRDRNDGGPVGTARVTAQPGGRSTEVAADGTYSLRLRPGSYTLRAAAPGGYRAAERSVVVVADGTHPVSFELAAPVATLAPSSIRRAVDLGETASATMTLRNDGTAPLRWELVEREISATPPQLPSIEPSVTRVKGWRRSPLPAGIARATVTELPAGLLEPVITDPAGDAEGSPDLGTVRAGADGVTMGMDVAVAPGGSAAQMVGLVYFDTDQDATTGLDPEELIGLPSHDIGVDYFADLFYTHDEEPVVAIVDAAFELVAIVPARVDGDSIAFDVPLEAMGGDDGNIDTALVVGDFSRPTDWGPNVGHGTIRAATDAPWMTPDVTSGRLLPGATRLIEVKLGGPGVGPAVYEGQLAVRANAPRAPFLEVPVRLTVRLPESFGAVKGKVSDAHTGEPLADARVLLRAMRDGSAYDVRARTGPRGRYQLFAPAGTWQLEVRKPGFVAVTRSVTIEAGESTLGVDAMLHAREPHAQLTGDPVALELMRGQSSTSSLVLGNPGGHVPLDFTIAESSSGGAPVAGAGRAAGTGSWISRAPSATTVTANRNGTRQARPSAYRWTAAAPTSGLSVLVYVDDPFRLPDTFVDQALQRLGMTYTAYYEDWHGFEGDLATGGWDLAIVANDNLFLETSAYDALADHVGAGGRLIFTGWAVGSAPEHPLWEMLGVSWAGDDDVPPGDPVFWWDAGHPVFNDPERVPELPPGDDVDFFIYGQRVAATTGTALGGYTPDPAADEAALVLGPLESTLFKGFLDAPRGSDDDEDGIPDIVELYMDMTQGIIGGFASDVPWLSVTPASGRIQPDATRRIAVTVDATGLAPGRYEASVVVRTNDASHAVMRHPVSLVVPRSRRGLDAGGDGYVTADGKRFVADRAYATGGFGYVGTSTPLASTEAIDGTADDPLFQGAREGMTAYRFDVADGRYRVRLLFAELGSAAEASARRFDVTLEDENVLDNLNVASAAGGRFTALVRTFEVRVRDGVLRVGFDAGTGETLINAIEVTGLPPGG